MKTIPYICLSFLLVSCAQFVPPTGGKKDIIPPKLLQSIPDNQSTNFKGSSIRLIFNELIDATSLRQELIITPQPDGAFEVKTKPTEVTIKFEEPFLDSTTYTFNFGKGIKDLTEKNPAQNLKLVFSTSDQIDSLSIKGKINYLWTGQIAENVLVGLYDLKSLDTIPILKRKPTYFYKTDTTGSFQFNNLKSTNYQIIAFQDINTNLYFDQEKEQIGFLSDTIKLDSNITSLNLSIYPSDWSAIKMKRTLSRQNNYSITFNKNYKKINVHFPLGDTLTYQFRDKELLFYNYPISSDTILTNILVLDSLGQELNLEQKIYFQSSINKKTNKPEELRIKSKIKPNLKLKTPIQYHLEFEYPITALDTTLIQIIGDTTYIEQYSYQWEDPSHTSLLINTNPIAQREIKLSIPAGSITNYKSDSNSTYTLINTLYPQTIYGLIDGYILNDSINHIVELVSEKDLEVVDFQYTMSKFNFNKIIPGNYYLRIIDDINNNNRWDTGNFLMNTIPEPIKIYPAILKIKENFEIRNIKIE